MPLLPFASVSILDKYISVFGKEPISYGTIWAPRNTSMLFLGLIFLKYISDAFEEKYKEVLNDSESDSEDCDDYFAANVFWVVPEARWQFVVDNAKQPTIGQMIDNAMIALEKDNIALKGVLPKNCQPRLEQKDFWGAFD